MIQKSKFFDLIISENIITEEDAKKLDKKYDGDLFAILEHLIKIKVTGKNRLGKLWGDSIGVSYVDMNKTLFQSLIVQKLPETFASKNCIIPLYSMENVVTVATSTPLDLGMLDEAKKLIGAPISAIFSFPDEIKDAIEIQYKSGDLLSKSMTAFTKTNIFKDSTEITSDQLKNLAGNEYIIEFSRNIMLWAVKERASDIHIEPQEDMVYIRFRIDGVLQDRLKIENALLAPFISRLKIIANLDITEKRKPQDGRITLALSGKSLDFRISIVPTIYGEKIVMRSLGQILTNEVPDLKELNFSKINYTIVKRIIDAPNGIFFVTGPTGSGKSTTLFAVLQYLNRSDINIMTIEDPVEYRLHRVNQVQVKPEVGFTFGTALKSFLRQDPDVILIGEIRDLETAKIASQAALTGHLVLATIHTNNAIQAVTRLIEIGVEPFLVAPSIIGVMGQRLVRRICDHCREAYKLTPEEIEKYFIWDGKTDVYFYRGKGCPECNNTGYYGRMAIHELFTISNEIRTLIAEKASIIAIEKASKRSGDRNMYYDGLKKVLMGFTSIEEVERVTIAEE